MEIVSDGSKRGAIWIRMCRFPRRHDLRDGLPSQLGPVALGAQVASIRDKGAVRLCAKTCLSRRPHFSLLK